ncbi:MAG: glycoside hydrolase family 97 protein [Syntrophothermus sp.]
MKRTFLLFFLLFLHTVAFNQQYRIYSPNKNIIVTFTLDRGIPYYSVSRTDQSIIKNSKLGYILKENVNLKDSFRVKNTTKNYFNELWTQVWGEQKDIRNNYEELSVDLEGRNNAQLKIIFRVFNDGVGFRYVIPGQKDLDSINVIDELTEFNLTKDYKSWFIKAFLWNRYEYLYHSANASLLDTVQTPVTMESNNLCLSFHEAALYNYPSMTIGRVKGLNFKSVLYPWSDGILVKARKTLTSPWRTIQIADKPGDLITSYLILNLNEPNKLKDVSWIKSAKYVGIWWEMHLDKATWSSGPKHGATTENAKKYIDFASKYGFKGVLVEGWNEGWDNDWVKEGYKFNFTKPYPDFDIAEVTRYAKEKGVELIGHHETGRAIINYEAQMEDAFKFYKKYGVNVIKTGYVGHGQSVLRIDANGDSVYEWHHGQYMVEHYQRVVELAAKYHIMIDAHEPIKDTGIRRTWPNMMTREGARGQEYDAWDPNGGNPPEHTTILPFTRLLSGPMDFTPGIFKLIYPEYKPNNRVNTTLAKSLAHYVIIYSPLHMAADLPENYETNLKPFKFIQDVPTDWEKTEVLNAQIGDYLTIVRKDRNSTDWYLGSITDEEARTFEVTLTFLDEGKQYTAEIYADGKDADWKTNPYSIEITQQIVKKSTILKIILAAGGGCAIRFREVAGYQD